MTLRAGAVRAAAATAAAPAAAPPAAASVVFVMRVRLAFLPRDDDDERRDDEERPFDEDDDERDLLLLPREPPDAFPPLRPAIERFADDLLDLELLDPPRFFDDDPPRLFELLLLPDERFFDDEERLLEEPRDRLFEEDFFDDLPEELRFDAAMLCQLFVLAVRGNRTGTRDHAAHKRARWCTRCTETM